MGQHSAKVGQHSPKMDQHSLKMGQRSLKLLLPTRTISPQWPAVARKRLNPARGPGGPELPYGSSLLSEGERGRRPCRRPPPHPVPSKSGQGPAGPSAGRGIAVRQFSPLEGERGCTPCRRPTPPSKNPKKSRVLRCFLLFPFFPLFRSLWLKMGQHGPT